MPAARAVVVIEDRVTLMPPMAPAAIDDHDDLLPGLAAGRHPLVEIVAHLLGIPVRHTWREALRGAIVDGADDAKPHTAGDATPRAGLQPRLPCATLLRCDLALAQRAGGPASPRGAAPPAPPGPGKAPPDRFLCIEQEALPSTCSVLQAGACKRARGEISRGRRELGGFFFHHRGRWRGPAGSRSVGPTPWRVRDTSGGKGGSHAGGGAGS